jgi:amino acid transporter
VLCCAVLCRMLYAFSRDGAVPLSRWWRKVSPQFEAPVNAVSGILPGQLPGRLSDW